MKTNPGRFFEDYRLGEIITHAVPRSLSGGERALYHALYPARHALCSSDEFARACGLPASPLDDLVAFHAVFGKTVPDISLNAIANLGYAEGRWLLPVWQGDTTNMVRRSWNMCAGSWCANAILRHLHPKPGCRIWRLPSIRPAWSCRKALISPAMISRWPESRTAGVIMRWAS
jgi:hypothetical protein